MQVISSELVVCWMHIRWKKQLQERPVWLPSITYYPINSDQTTKQNRQIEKEYFKVK